MKTKTPRSKTLEAVLGPAHARYINVAAITSDARTISTQVWTDDAEDAHRTLEKWISPAEEKWHGHIALASIHDTREGTTLHFYRRGDKLFAIEPK
jgi:hypothetical protein